MVVVVFCLWVSLMMGLDLRRGGFCWIFWCFWGGICDPWAVRVLCIFVSVNRCLWVCGGCVLDKWIYGLWWVFLGAIGVRTIGYVVNQGVYGCGPAVLWVLPFEFWSRWWFEREEDVWDRVKERPDRRNSDRVSEKPPVSSFPPILLWKSLSLQD